MTWPMTWLQECEKIRNKIYGTTGPGPSAICLSCMIRPYKNCGICGRGICEECYWGPCDRVNQYLHASIDHRCVDNPLTKENHPRSFPTPATYKCGPCGAITYSLYTRAYKKTPCLKSKYKDREHRWLQCYPGMSRRLLCNTH